MRNKNIIMLLISSLILSGCGPEPEDKKSQQQQSTTPTDQQVLAAQQAATKVAEQSAAKAAADAKALAQQEVQQYSDKQALLGRLQAAPKYQHAAREKAASQIANPATARYQQFDDNPVKQVAQNPLATFSLDVDTGSYANVRRFLNQGLLPPPDAVRVEEIVNYFPSDWDIKDKQSIPASKPIPFAMRYELAPAPWNEQRTLLKVDILAKDRKSEELPASNLVFLIDTSGSMISDERLPLIQSSLKLLVKELREQDNIAIVTYAGDSRIALPSISGSHKAVPMAVPGWRWLISRQRRGLLKVVSIAFYWPLTVTLTLALTIQNRLNQWSKNSVSPVLLCRRLAWGIAIITRQ